MMTKPQKRPFHNRVKESDKRAQRNDHNQGPDSNWTAEEKAIVTTAIENSVLEVERFSFQISSRRRIIPSGGAGGKFGLQIKRYT